VFGFESRTWPSAVVEGSTGKPCDVFEARADVATANDHADRRRRSKDENGLYG